MFEKILTLIKKILSRDDSKGNVSVLNIKGKLQGSDCIERFNILEELLFTEKRVLRLGDRTRAVEPEFMFQEIIESYFMLKDELDEFINPLKFE